MNKYYNELASVVESALKKAFVYSKGEYDVLYEAMKYAVLNGGKRLRGVLMLECGLVCGLTREEILPFACAIEMIHASTLIHDDLPAMDDDDYRRGQPACHIKFGEDVALMAGDALYSYALEHILRNTLEQNYSGSMTAALLTLVSLAGTDGVYGGQILDKKYETASCTEEQLLQLHAMKTGALFSACARIPCILGRADGETEKALRLYMKKLGLAFQVKDDLLDLEGDFETLGKAVGADENKSTFISVLGAEASKAYLFDLICGAEGAVKDVDESGLLGWICDFVMNRNS